jgi:hypothetical protein
MVFLPKSVLAAVPLAILSDPSSAVDAKSLFLRVTGGQKYEDFLEPEKPKESKEEKPKPTENAKGVVLANKSTEKSVVSATPHATHAANTVKNADGTWPTWVSDFKSMLGLILEGGYLLKLPQIFFELSVLTKKFLSRNTHISKI